MHKVYLYEIRPGEASGEAQERTIFRAEEHYQDKSMHRPDVRAYSGSLNEVIRSVFEGSQYKELDISVETIPGVMWMPDRTIAWPAGRVDMMTFFRGYYSLVEHEKQKVAS